MSLEFITRRELIENTTFSVFFEWRDMPGAGFGFDATPDGTIIAPAAQAGRDNLQRCLDGTYDVRRGRLQTFVNRYWQPASVRCDCGATIWLEDAMTNECGRCGLLANGSGQRLAPVAQWSDEDRYAVFGPQNDGDDY